MNQREAITMKLAGQFFNLVIERGCLGKAREAKVELPPSKDSEQNEVDS